MKAVEIKKGIYWVGAIDWDVRNFHGYTYTTRKGTTYNSYLIIDDKITLIDGVHRDFTAEMLERIKSIIDPSKIDYIIANHVEQDHSGALPQLVQLCPNAKMFGTEKCKEGLYKNHFVDFKFQIVKSGDKLNLGKRNLVFLEAAMLHWPDSMFTYCPEEEILFPNDAFGQHYASSARFADEVDQSILMDEAAKYYANILWHFGSLVVRKIEEVQKMNISIKMIAPSHGLIWRKEALKIVSAYLNWAKQETTNKAIIVYETMWGSTAKMAHKIAQGLIDSGVNVQIYDINKSDKSDVIKEMLDAKYFLFGSSTHDNGMLPHIAGFLELVKGFKPKKRVAGVFGSFGWSGGAVKEIEEILLKTGGMDVIAPSQSVKYVPDEKELESCYNFGLEIAKR